MRLIDAEELQTAVLTEDAMSDFWNDDYEVCEYFMTLIDDAPTIDTEPVKHGRWSPDCVCSECGEVPRSGMEENYCPNCGAKMDEED